MKLRVLLILATISQSIYAGELSDSVFDYRTSASDKLNIKVLEPKGNVRGVEATKVIDTSFKALLKTVTDYDNFTEYMPNVDKSKIVKEVSGDKLVETELDFGLFDVEYTLKMSKTVEDSNSKSFAKVSWKRVSGEMKEIEGYWLLYKIHKKDSSGKEKEGVAVKYVSYVDPGLAIPGWIQDMLTEGAVPDLFEAIEKRSKKNS